MDDAELVSDDPKVQAEQLSKALDALSKLVGEYAQSCNHVIRCKRETAGNGLQIGTWTNENLDRETFEYETSVSCSLPEA